MGRNLSWQEPKGGNRRSISWQAQKSPKNSKKWEHKWWLLVGGVYLDASGWAGLSPISTLSVSGLLSTPIGNPVNPSPNCQPRPYLAIRSPNQDLMSCKIRATWSLALECEEMVWAQEKNQRLWKLSWGSEKLSTGTGWVQKWVRLLAGCSGFVRKWWVVWWQAGRCRVVSIGI